MKLRHHVGKLLVCCSVLWVVVSSTSSNETACCSPPECDSMLAFSSNISPVSEGGGDIRRRSLCTWKWRSSTVKNRIPSTLWEAECSSSLCSGPNKPSLNSLPIYQSVLVLHRQQGGSCYTASFQSVSVGCTCVWAQTSQN
ncbi:interleukin-17A-like [Solea senegalensis]|uniref:Interleukin-17A-like n=1 Tax=Solea senegalensis TaxID=28829 RepID=A0AAV6Q4B0_SOLSE|nr:interleukin 17a/f2 [Solea senegalensis]KAG7481924.1 interleukin-17A-like [Solea senegalensis]